MWSLRKGLTLTLGSVVALTNCAPPPKRGSQPAVSQPTEQPKSRESSETSSLPDSRYDRALNAIRISPLGLLVQTYLFPQPHLPKVESTDITERVFASGGRSISALSALHLLIHDISKSQKLEETQQTRLLILQADLFQRQQDVSSYPGEGLAYSTILGFLATLPLGYPPVRHSLRYVSRILFNKPAGAQTPIFSGARTYNPLVPIKTFFSFFGPFTLLYFFWFDWKESARGHSVGSRIDRSMSEEEFNEILEELRAL